MIKPYKLLFNAILFLLINTLVLYGASFIPSIPISWEFYDNHLEFSKLVFWISLLFFGFMYGAAIHERKNLLLSRRGSYKEVCKLLIAGLFMFFLSPIFAIHSTSDNIQDNLFFQNWPSTKAQSICYNVFFYNLPCLIGLHFCYLDHVPLLNRMFYAITFPPSLQKYGTFEYCVLLGISIPVLGIVAFQVYCLIYLKKILVYGVLLLSSILLISLTAYFLRKSYLFHLHHYFIFGFLLIFIPVQNVISSSIQAMLAGMFIEGISTWGMDPMFYRIRNPHAQNGLNSISPLLEDGQIEQNFDNQVENDQENISEN